MKWVTSLVLPVFVSVIGMTWTCSTTAHADEAAVRKMVAAYIDAFNNHDLDAIAAMWTENGSHTDRDTGARTEGREAIQADLRAVFQDRPNTRLAGQIDRIRAITPDVAHIEGQTTLAEPGQAPSVSVFSAIVIQANGGWFIDSIEESPQPQSLSSYDALRDLEWLVGRWLDKSDEANVETTVKWTSNKSFLLRSFVTHTPEGVAQQGTQVIGWDPRSRQIRSWTFNSDGSFGDATWSKNGEDWLIKSAQTLSDGQAASGTFVLSQVDGDTLTLQLIGHEIEGAPQPAREPVTVVRVADTNSSPPTTSNDQ